MQYFKGSFCGQLSSLPPQVLGATVIKEVVNRSGLNSEDISEVLFGNVSNTVNFSSAGLHSNI